MEETVSEELLLYITKKILILDLPKLITIMPETGNVTDKEIHILKKSVNTIF